MKYAPTNRFKDFFKEGKYVTLKNYLYNYLLRKIAVEKSLQNEKLEIVLELGSGISPVMTRTDRIIYTDLSFSALKVLKRKHGRGRYVVSDAIHLPFKPGVFSHTICSEVLEHIEDDQKAIKELARVMKPSSRLIITFPHRRKYFAYDDRFVNHLRRYELPEMVERLKAAGFKPAVIRKVLGPLEKVTMCFVVFWFSVLQKRKSRKVKKTRKIGRIDAFVPFFDWLNRLYMGLIWLDAMIMPRALSTVLLI
ncbi:class I SAM-dependent methyltransferase, partial [Thermodesulfobacteriota bacterium]